VTLGTQIDWTNVLVALIAGLPAIIAAIGVLFVHRAIRTPSRTAIGRQVEAAHHVALANNLRLAALRATAGASESPNVAAHLEKASADATLEPPIGPENGH
jgi:hypothetical protein